MTQAWGPTQDQERALSQLVAEGTLTSDQVVVVRRVLWTPSATASGGPLSVVIEAAGYVGGSLMVAAAALLIGLNWDAFGHRTVIRLLVGFAAALVVAGVLVAGGPQRIPTLRRGGRSVRRRLVGVLLAFSALPAAWAAGSDSDQHSALVGGLYGLVVAVFAYALIPTIPGVLVIAVMSVVATGGALQLTRFDAQATTWAFGALGIVWGIVSVLGLIKPRHIGFGLGAAIAILGAQLSIGSNAPLAYGMTFGFAVLCFVGYWVERATTLLAFGVIGATIAVPEAVQHATHSSLSGPTILFLSGAALVAMSAVGLWLRSVREPKPPKAAPQPEAPARPQPRARPRPRARPQPRRRPQPGRPTRSPRHPEQIPRTRTAEPTPELGAPPRRWRRPVLRGRACSAGERSALHGDASGRPGATGGHGSGQRIERVHCGLPAHAGVGDALTVRQRPVRRTRSWRPPTRKLSSMTPPMPDWPPRSARRSRRATTAWRTWSLPLLPWLASMTRRCLRPARSSCPARRPRWLGRSSGRPCRRAG